MTEEELKLALRNLMMKAHGDAIRTHKHHEEDLRIINLIFNALFDSLNS